MKKGLFYALILYMVGIACFVVFSVNPHADEDKRSREQLEREFSDIVRDTANLRQLLSTASKDAIRSLDTVKRLEELDRRLTEQNRQLIDSIGEFRRDIKRGVELSSGIEDAIVRACLETEQLGIAINKHLERLRKIQAGQ